jgi:hypothetical protein
VTLERDVVVGSCGDHFHAAREFHGGPIRVKGSAARCVHQNGLPGGKFTYGGDRVGRDHAKVFWTIRAADLNAAGKARAAGFDRNDIIEGAAVYMDGLAGRKLSDCDCAGIVKTQAYSSAGSVNGDASLNGE